IGIALFFIPALMEKLPLKRSIKAHSFKRKRRIVALNLVYLKCIRFSKRYKWIYILLFVLGFGIPIHWLPDKLEKEEHLHSIYNKTMGSDWFVQEVKPVLSKVVGGALRLFSENVFEKSYYVEPSRTTLTVSGSMPEGCTTRQLNEAVKKMEAEISVYPEVELFQTTIYGPHYSAIQIHFTDSSEFTGFPYFLKEELTSKAIQLGGVDWNIYGVGRGFSNALSSGYKSSRIILEGYNYDQLYGYATKLMSELLKNPRVKEAEITGSTQWNYESLHEYYLEFQPEMFALHDISLYRFYDYLHNKLFQSSNLDVFIDNRLHPVTLVSSDQERFQVWNLENEPIRIGDKQVKLPMMGSIEKRKTGNSIHKNNQQYRLIVAYNFMGPHPLETMVKEEQTECLNEVLPLGYRVVEENFSWMWNQKDKTPYFLILLVIVIIYFICSILLESLSQPLAIIGMIPVSFIGIFLTFYLFDINFDQGGFASFILLCGISVNSGLYILNDYNQMLKQSKRLKINCYMNAFRHKIFPIILTIFSTCLGLVPFIWDGQNEVFWFSFASGAIGGLIFSLVALLVFLPLAIRTNEPKR
nr:efflux RND transporter permease subunit [Prolixibacteraceae bacterium]